MSAIQHPELILPALWNEPPVTTLPANEPGRIIFTRQLWQRNMPATSPSEHIVSIRSQSKDPPQCDTTGQGARKRTSSAISTHSCCRSASPSRGLKTPLTPKEAPLFCTTRKRNATIVDAEDAEVKSANSTAAQTQDNSGELAIHVCICQPEPKIPRPRNAFILYRQHNQANVVAQNPGLANPDISKIIGEQWQNQPPEVKNKWKALAEEEKLRHQQQYPTYRYQPKRNGRQNSIYIDSANSEKPKCSKCGGQSILAPFSANASKGTTPTLTEPPTPASVTTPVSCTTPVLRDLSLLSPATRCPRKSSPNIVPPKNNRYVPEHGEFGPLSPETKRQRFNSDQPQQCTQIGSSCYESSPQGGPGAPGASFSFNQAPSSLQYSQTEVQVRSETLPGLRGIVGPPGTMGPPPRPLMGYEQHRLSQGHISHDRSLTLPPLQTGGLSGAYGATAIVGSGKSAEEQIMSIDFQYKIKVLSQVAPPAMISETSRGPFIAIEGEDPSAVVELGIWLHNELKKSDQLNVSRLDGPDVSANADKKPMVQYHLLATAWLNKTDEILASISYSSKATVFDPTIDALSPITNPIRSSRGIDEKYYHSRILPKERASESSSDSVEEPSTHQHPSVMSNEEKMDVDSKFAPTTAFPPPANASMADNRKPVTIVSNFSLHASNVFACRIPIGPRDLYSPSDHWQWMATQWRGVIGPDLTIFIRDAITEEAGRSTVEMSTEGNLFVIKRTRNESDKVLELEPSLLRRLSFEVTEWARAFGSEKRGSA
ncbi:hypothetical protein M433DRAFT_162477 [Acidomyces richmondensis BFW]|nr:MAG: hypothetical protein FE78DRAFT_109601 [Acidomyces sp. 'richmondensis']KYG49561.1 hypothetical protein M433DRAFT_162477 [Acidomyces richmondensis BFW]